MVHEFVNGTYRQTNLPNDPPDYLAKREELRLAEIALTRQIEEVAALRRSLPPGATLHDYEFLDATHDPSPAVRLTDLFTAPRRPLVLYHLMYGKKQTSPCPMCTLWTDGFNGIAPHLAQHADFAIIAAAEPAALRDHARSRNWTNLRLLSAGTSTFKYDLGSEAPDGGQDSTVTVLTREPDGTPRHFYTAHPRMAPDLKERGTDLLAPLWHLLDLTPNGRGAWYPSLTYPPKR